MQFHYFIYLRPLWSTLFHNNKSSFRLIISFATYFVLIFVGHMFFMFFPHHSKNIHVPNRLCLSKDRTSTLRCITKQTAPTIPTSMDKKIRLVAASTDHYKYQTHTGNNHSGSTENAAILRYAALWDKQCELRPTKTDGAICGFIV